MWGCNKSSAAGEEGSIRSVGRHRQSGRPHSSPAKDGVTVRLDRLTGTVDSVGGEIDGMNGRVSRLRDQKVALQRQLEGLSKATADQDGALARLDVEKEEWSLREGRLRDDCAQLTRLLEASNRLTEQAEEQRRLLQGQADQLVCEVAEELRDAGQQMQELNRLMMMGDRVTDLVCEEQLQLSELRQPSEQLRQVEDETMQYLADADSVAEVM